MINAGLIAPAALVSLTRIPQLHGISISADGGVTIGAATRHNEVAGDSRLRGTAAVLPHAMSQIAGTAVRNMGTIGGAVAHADPGLDCPPALFALDATVEIASAAGRRLVPIREFFTDWFTTVLEPGEIVAAIRLRKPQPGAGLYLKHARVSGDYAIASIAISLAADGEVHVAVGGCGPAPLWSAQADQILSGALSAAAVAGAGDVLVELANPVDDVRGSADYRRMLIPRLLARAVAEVAVAAREAA